MRNKFQIYLPAEQVCGNELEPKVRKQLFKIASFTLTQRHAAIEEIRQYLKARSSEDQVQG